MKPQSTDLSPEELRVMFLDFDGVILTYRTLLASEHLGHSNAAPDPMLCALLRRICQRGVKIVVSSSWRDAEEICKAKLAEGSLLEFLHEDWRTKELGIGKDSRAREVSEWLERNQGVTDYRILDDDYFDWTPEQMSKWIECSPYDGMPAMAMKDLAEWGGVVRQSKSAIATGRAS